MAIQEAWSLEGIKRELSGFFENKGFPIEFTKEDLLEEALTHSSYLNEHVGSKSNEKLAVLGDSVLDLAASAYLYERSTSKGELTQRRSELVNNKRLAKLARQDSLDSYLRLSEGERKNRTKPQKIMSNAYEALIGLVLLNNDYDTAARFVRKAIIEPQVQTAI